MSLDEIDRAIIKAVDKYFHEIDFSNKEVVIRYILARIPIVTVNQIVDVLDSLYCPMLYNGMFYVSKHGVSLDDVVAALDNANDNIEVTH